MLNLGNRMIAHQVDADGVIINTIVVDSLDAVPGLIDASIGGNIGDSVVNGEVVPAPSRPLADRRAEAWERIKAKRDAVKVSGVLAGGKWFHTDPDSRIQQLGLVLMGSSVPAVQWKTLDGSFIAMSQTLAGQIFQAVGALDTAAFAAAETHRAAVYASDTPESYDFSGGWPTVYQS